MSDRSIPSIIPRVCLTDSRHDLELRKKLDGILQTHQGIGAYGLRTTINDIEVANCCGRDILVKDNFGYTRRFGHAHLLGTPPGLWFCKTFAIHGHDQMDYQIPAALEKLFGEGNDIVKYFYDEIQREIRPDANNPDISRGWYKRVKLYLFVPVEELFNADGVIYVPLVNLTVGFSERAQWIKHPFAMGDVGFTHFPLPIKNPEQHVGVDFQLVDNVGDMSVQYINLYDKIVKLVPQPDPHRTSGLWVYRTKNKKSLDYEDNKGWEFFSFEEGKRRFGLFPSKEAAEMHGNYEDVIKRNREWEKIEFEREKMVLEREKMQHEREQREHELSLKSVKQSNDWLRFIVDALKSVSSIFSVVHLFFSKMKPPAKVKAAQ